MPHRTTRASVACALCYVSMLLLLFVAEPTFAALNTTSPTTPLCSWMVFARPEHCRPDSQSKIGALRFEPPLNDDSKPVGPNDPRASASFDVAVSLADEDRRAPFELLRHGFERVTLADELRTDLDALYSSYAAESETLRTHTNLSNPLSIGLSYNDGVTRLATRMSGPTSRSFVAPSLTQGIFPLAWNLYCTGAVARKTLPNGREADATVKGSLSFVHIDQDCDGRPLTVLAGGILSTVFQPWSPVKILNVWLPLGSVPVRPMAFVDIGQVNRQESQAHLALANDQFRFVPHESLEFKWFPDVEVGKAVVFQTTQTPHASFSLPGEDLLERYVVHFERLVAALGDTDNAARDTLCARHVLDGSLEHYSDNEATTHTTQRTTHECEFSRLPRIEGHLKSARTTLNFACAARDADQVTDALARLAAWRLSVTRISLEMRCATVFISPAVLVALVVFVSLPLFLLVKLVRSLAGRFGRPTRVKLKLS